MQAEANLGATRRRLLTPNQHLAWAITAPNAFRELSGFKTRDTWRPLSPHVCCAYSAIEAGQQMLQILLFSPSITSNHAQ